MPSKKLKTLKLRKLTFKNKDYAFDEDTNYIYDLRSAKAGHLVLVGELRANPNKKRKFFIRLADSPTIVESTKLLIGKKLDNINLSKHAKFIEEEFAPDGPGYSLAKKRFETHKSTQKRKRSRARSLSVPRKKSRSRKRKTKSIGGIIKR